MKQTLGTGYYRCQCFLHILGLLLLGLLCVQKMEKVSHNSEFQYEQRSSFSGTSPWEQDMGRYHCQTSSPKLTGCGGDTLPHSCHVLECLVQDNDRE